MQASTIATAMSDLPTKTFLETAVFAGRTVVAV
jgi:hypothetical protein